MIGRKNRISISKCLCIDYKFAIECWSCICSDAMLDCTFPICHRLFKTIFEIICIELLYSLIIQAISLQFRCLTFIVLSCLVCYLLWYFGFCILDIAICLLDFLEIGGESFFSVIAMLQLRHDIYICKLLCIGKLLKNTLRIIERESDSLMTSFLISDIEIHHCHIYDTTVWSIGWYLLLCNIDIFLTCPQTQSWEAMCWSLYHHYT